jgi:TonB-dependent receptor
MKRHLLILLLLIVFHFSLSGQNATEITITGKVSDDFFNETLIGVAVVIEGTSRGTITDTNGDYSIRVPGPESVLVFSYLGYNTERITVGNQTIINVRLTPDVTTLTEIQVYAQLLGQKEALNRQVNAIGLVNVVSSDRMRELPDVNAAEAIGRLPGVSINRVGGEGTSVVLRGLSPKLTSVTINNVRVPPSDANDRSVNLAMISPELLSDIEVFKSPTADMDGDAIGGVINLGVSRAATDPVQQFRFYGGYNSLLKDLNNYKGSFNLSHRFFDQKLGAIIRGNFENTNRSSESVSVGWNRRNEQDTFLLTNSLDILDTKRYTNRIGGNIQLDYSYNSGEVIFQSFLSRRNVDINSLNNSMETTSGEINHSTRSANFRDLTTQNMLSGKQHFAGFQLDWVLAHSKTTSDKGHDVRLNFRQTNSFEDEVKGQYVDDPELIIKHRKMDYNSTYLLRYLFEPDMSDHTALTGAVDLKRDYKIGQWIKGFVKTGAKIKTDDRVYNQNHQMVFWYYLLPSYALNAAKKYPGLELGGPDNDKIMISNFYTSNDAYHIWNNSNYFLHPNLDRTIVDNWHDVQKDDLTRQFDAAYLDYEATEKVYAGYIMGTLEVGKWLRIVPGVRYEKSDNAYLGYYSSYSTHGDSGTQRDTTTYQTYGELLPNFHMKVSPFQWFDVRFSAVKTISRPDFNMVAPRTRVDLTNGNLFRGNPELRHAKAWNYDASLSFYSSRLGIISVGAFYKKFDDYFTSISRSMSSTEATSLNLPPTSYDVRMDYMNFDNSEVKGLEVEIQTNLSFLPGYWKGVVINANASRMWSKTFFPLFIAERVWNPARRRFEIDFDASYFDYVEAPLPSQVDFIANLSLGYDMKGFSARASMVYQGASMRNFRVGGTEEGLKYTRTYSDDYLRFDASLSKRIGKNFTVLASLANITGEGERSYRYQSKYITNNNKYGPFYELGLQYRF